MNKIDTHLGKTASGESKPAYVTPDSIDPSLLVTEKRIKNRREYGIDTKDFVGYDRWNCYEFSTLTETGFPLTGRLQIVYVCSSELIVESKSLKLYLNSYNMHRQSFDRLVDLELAVIDQVKHDLSKVGITAEVACILDLKQIKSDSALPFVHHFHSLERSLLYDWTPEKRTQELVTRECPEGKMSRHRGSIRSNCKVTNQPDWGTTYIAYEANEKEVTKASLFSFITSFRTQSHFHEEICEILYKHIWDAVEPKNLLVACNYLRRGGIDINPVRASSIQLLEQEVRSPISFDITRDPRQ